MAFIDITNIRKNGLGYYARAAWLHIVLIYLVVFVFGAVFLIPMADRHIDKLTRQALTAVENEFSNLQTQLIYLTESGTTSLQCDEITTRLRGEVFRSDIAKEIGVFRPSGEVYCTSSDLGNSFFLYQTIMDRLEESKVTLSYTKSKMSQVRSTFLLFTGESKYGVSVVIPPRYIIRLVEDLPEKGVNFSIEVITREIVSVEEDNNVVNEFTYQSDSYPLSVTFYTSSDYYISFFITNLWMGLLLASLLTVYYVFARQKWIAGGSLDTALKNALEDGNLDVYYQPIVNSRTKEVVGCESLVRWNDPIQGFISPSIFIPLAEKINLIDEITEQVMSRVIAFIVEHKNLLGDRYISINISRSLILREDFVASVVHNFTGSPEITKRLVFEITEDINFSANELDVLKSNLQKMANIGIRVAIDDFGTGYSGLDFIRQYPFDIFKIDRVFVNNLSSDSTIIPLLESMRLIANTLNMNVIVEGVEEEKQVEILAELGFHNIQGFYYYRPMPKKEVLEVLK